MAIDRRPTRGAGSGPGAEFRSEVLAYAAKTSLAQAARTYGIPSAIVRDWAYRARKAAAMQATDPNPTDALEPPPDPEPVEGVIDVEGEAEPTWTPLADRLPKPAESEALVARTVDGEAQAALMACFTRIRNAAATAPLKEVTRAAQVVGELILAANVTNQSLARKLADKLEGR